MCGVFGILQLDGTTLPSEDRLRRSAEALKHRGPDGVGVYAGIGVGLAHTRLSLVDLDERSDQPIWDLHRRYCLVYNGEIYNFRELRQELLERVITFRTSSDTEVLLQLLIHDGAKRTLPRLRGMFAFGFYDEKDKKLIIARDRFGIKPMLLFRDSEKFMFASEAKAMSEWLELKANSFQLIRFLMNYPVPVRDRCFFDDIEMMPPGTMMTVQADAELRTESFSTLPDLISGEKRDELDRLDPAQAVDHVDGLLQRAVDRMLFADAPVGALCSGGVDSSLLMALAARKHSNLAIFHADVVGRESEFDAASALAKHLKLDLLSVKVHDKDFLKMLPEVLNHYEYPFSGHPHSVPFLMVSKLVRDNGVKGVLTGEGSDECFLGYNDLAYAPIWNSYTACVAGVGRAINRIPVLGPRLWKQAKRPDLVADMLGQFSATVDFRAIRDTYQERLGRKPDQNMKTLNLLSMHLRTLLHRNDTMGMAASIEARFPFLDEELVETAVNFPYRYKIRFSPTVWEKEHPFLRDKWVVRAVADRYLPPVLSRRKKWGFGVSAFERTDVAPEFFRDSFVSRHFKLTHSELAHFLEQANQGLRSKLLMLDAWGQMFVDKVPQDTVRLSLERYASIRKSR